MTNSAVGQKQAISYLESVAKSADQFETSAVLRDKDGNDFTVTVSVEPNTIAGYVLEPGHEYPDVSGLAKVPNELRPFSKRHYKGPGRKGGSWGASGEKMYTFEEVITSLANGLPEAYLLVERIKVSCRNGTIKGSELKQAAIEAWCEAYGIPAPTAKELKEAKAKNKNLAAEKKAQVEEQLRSASGIQIWNSQTTKERKVHDLKGLNLVDATLKSANFANLDFSKTNFSSADLTGSNFDHATVRNCNFNNCKFHDMNFRAAAQESTLHDAEFKNVDCWGIRLNKAALNGARFKNVDFTRGTLEGADFTGAMFSDDCKLENCSFDEHTIFPDDFKHMDQLVYAGKGIDPRKVKAFNESHATEGLTFDKFLERLGKCIDKDRLKKSLSMLKKESFQLFSEVKDDSVTGVVKSQTDAELVYSCRLTSEGTYSCCTQNLNPCGGLRGAICKHILVLILGLAKANELDANKADVWARASALHQPKLDKDMASEIFLRYKGAEAGEIDWRPTETTPEDFYAF